MLAVRLSGFFSGVGISCWYYYTRCVLPQNVAHAQHIQQVDAIDHRLKSSWGKIHKEAMEVLRASPYTSPIEEKHDSEEDCQKELSNETFSPSSSLTTSSAAKETVFNN